MAKAIDDSVYDAASNEIATATRISACSAQPANFAGIAAVSLANSTLGAGDFTNANGDTSGRKVTVGAKNGVTIDSTGTANHVALDDGSTLLIVTTAGAQVISSTGNTLNFGSFKVEFADPT